MAGSSTANRDQPVFYYDLGSPQCYIVAETIMATLPVVPEWEPVLGAKVATTNPEPDSAQTERSVDAPTERSSADGLSPHGKQRTTDRRAFDDRPCSQRE